MNFGVLRGINWGLYRHDRDNGNYYMLVGYILGLVGVGVLEGHKVYGLEFRIQSVRVWGFAVRTPRLASAALAEQCFLGGDLCLQPYADMSL